MVEASNGFLDCCLMVLFREIVYPRLFVASLGSQEVPFQARVSKGDRLNGPIEGIHRDKAGRFNQSAQHDDIGDRLSEDVERNSKTISEADLRDSRRKSEPG